MGKVVDTAGRKILDTSAPSLQRPKLAEPGPAPLVPVPGPVETVRTRGPGRAALVVMTLAMLGGFGLLFAQASQSGARIEAHMGRVERLDGRFDAVTAKLDAMATRLDATAAKVDGLPGQISTGFRDANKTLTESLNAGLNTLSQRLAAQQQQQAPIDRGSLSPYGAAPGAIRPRRSFP